MVNMHFHITHKPDCYGYIDHKFRNTVERRAGFVIGKLLQGIA